MRKTLRDIVGEVLNEGFFIMKVKLLEEIEAWAQMVEDDEVSHKLDQPLRDAQFSKAQFEASQGGSPYAQKKDDPRQNSDITAPNGCYETQMKGLKGVLEDPRQNLDLTGISERYEAQRNVPEQGGNECKTHYVGKAEPRLQSAMGEDKQDCAPKPPDPEETLIKSSTELILAISHFMGMRSNFPQVAKDAWDILQKKLSISGVMPKGLNVYSYQKGYADAFEHLSTFAWHRKMPQ